VIHWEAQRKPEQYTGPAKACWKSSDGKYAIFAMPADWRGEFPDYFWVGLLDGNPIDSQGGVSRWLADAATFHEAKQIAEGYHAGTQD
jgi:hypothetical protein